MSELFIAMIDGEKVNEPCRIHAGNGAEPPDLSGCEKYTISLDGPLIVPPPNEYEYTGVKDGWHQFERQSGNAIKVLEGSEMADILELPLPIGTKVIINYE